MTTIFKGVVFLTMKTKPFEHQRVEWEESRDLATRAILWEQGTGKTKLTIDTAFHLFTTGKIDAVIVLAPNGVHENWVTDELPAHAWGAYKAMAYKSKSAKTKWHERAFDELLTYDGLAFGVFSYDGFMTEAGTKAAKKFLQKRRCLYVLDESQRIKTPSAKRTKRVVSSGRYAEYRRILSGTPITNSPFDIYTQMRFLDPDYWKDRGFASLESFKTYFGVWEDRINGQTGQRFKHVVHFKNLEQLHELIDPAASRVTKDAVLDLPEKVYTKRYYELSSEQKRRYKELKEELCTELESGQLITAPLVITQLLRLQQLILGYLPSGEEEGQLVLLAENPRMRLLMDTLQDVNGKAIIYARFSQDIEQICHELGDHAVRYDGRTSEEARLEARRRFQDPNDPVRFFVGNPAACATGLTLTAAKTVIYYSNSFNWEHRTQSEDRAHRIGQDSNVHYIDLAAHGTVDTRIIQALRDKDNIATKITGDNARQWL